MSRRKEPIFIKTSIFFLSIGLVTVVVVLFQGYLHAKNIRQSRAETQESHRQLTFTTSGTLGGHTFALAVAQTPEEQQLGLSFVPQLDPLHGMIFVFDHLKQRSFWMKDMMIALDILWFDQESKLVHIHENIHPDTFPQTFTPDVPIQYVLEIPAGSASVLGLSLGETLMGEFSDNENALRQVDETLEI